MENKSRETVTREQTLPDFSAVYDRQPPISEYMVVLAPHADLCDRIMALKQEFSDRYENKMAVALKPHVCILRFLQYEMKEQQICNRLRVLAMSLPAFKLELEGFGSFPSHTIYIRVKTQEPVKAIARKLREAQGLMKINKENKPHFPAEPHIGLARKLLPWQYEKGWQEYAARHFSGAFIAEELLLLKKAMGGKAWQVVERLRMMNLPVETKQGDLFG